MQNEPAPSWATDELLAACVTFHAWGAKEFRGDWKSPIRDLLDAIERAGLVPEPPKVTDVVVTLPLEWWA